MGIAVWALRAVLFFLVLVFALRNTEPVTVHLFLDAAWQPPLIVLLLAVLVAGVVLGMAALAGRLIALSGECRRLRRELDARPVSSGAPTLDPPRDA